MRMYSQIHLITCRAGNKRVNFSPCQRGGGSGDYALALSVANIFSKFESISDLFEERICRETQLVKTSRILPTNDLH